MLLEAPATRPLQVTPAAKFANPFARVEKRRHVSAAGGTLLNAQDKVNHSPAPVSVQTARIPSERDNAVALARRLAISELQLRLNQESQEPERWDGLS
jgi:hypothetical protein